MQLVVKVTPPPAAVQAAVVQSVLAAYRISLEQRLQQVLGGEHSVEVQVEL